MQVICGVDVSKAWLDAWVTGGVFKRFANDEQGVTELLALCRAQAVELVVMEPSGGVEQPAYSFLWAHGQPCALANAQAVRRFAQAMGYLEKTDRIDAEVIARFAQAKGLVAAAPPSARQKRLSALSNRLQQIAQDLATTRVRLGQTNEPLARASLVELMALLKRQMKALSAEITALIRDDPLWSALDQTLRSVKGVADRTVATLLAELGEIGTLSNKAIAKLAGLAPIANDSGKRQGRRPVRGGRAGVRSILYLVADIARKFDPDLAAFRTRLLDQGKPKMVVRIALARKLLVRLNAKARETRAQLAQLA